MRNNFVLWNIDIGDRTELRLGVNISKSPGHGNISPKFLLKSKRVFLQFYVILSTEW